MKVLMISPAIGGIDVYVKRLSEKMNEIDNVEVDIAGGNKNEIAYDINKKQWKSSQEVKEIAAKITERINFNNYDVVAFHYGKNDIEQYIPVILKDKQIRPKKAYFVHFLSRNLFSQYLGDDKAQREVEGCVESFYDYYVFFGKYAQDFMEKKYHKKLNGTVSFLPETHSHESLTRGELTKYEKIFNKNFKKNYKKIVCFTGFPANYKDSEILMNCLPFVKGKMLLVFAGQGWSKKLGFSSKLVGKVQVLVVDKYLTSKEYKYLTSASLFGVFPYKQPGNNEFFQGSGTLPNYIYEGKSTIVYNEGSLPEYVGKSGIVLREQTPNELSKAINLLLDNSQRRRFENKAFSLKNKFSIEQHSREVVNSFKNMLISEKE